MWNPNDIHILTHANLHTNTCACIPELGQKCWLNAPDSLPTQIQKRESGDKTRLFPVPLMYRQKLFFFNLCIIYFIIIILLL